MSIDTDYFVELRMRSLSSLQKIQTVLQRARPTNIEDIDADPDADLPVETALKRCAKGEIKCGPIIPNEGQFCMVLDAWSWDLDLVLHGCGDHCLFGTLIRYFPELQIRGLTSNDEDWAVIRQGEAIDTRNPVDIPRLTFPVKDLPAEAFLEILNAPDEGPWKQFATGQRRNRLVKAWLSFYLFREGLLMVRGRRHGITSTGLRRILGLGVEPERLYVGEELLTLLHAAAGFGRPRDVALILEGGFPVDSHNLWPDEDTFDEPYDHALHRAVDANKPGNVRVLLSDGAPLEAKGLNGDTPLHRAAKLGSKPMIRLLLRAGHRRRISNDEGALPVSLAPKDAQHLFLEPARKP